MTPDHDVACVITPLARRRRWRHLVKARLANISGCLRGCLRLFHLRIIGPEMIAKPLTREPSGNLSWPIVFPVVGWRQFRGAGAHTSIRPRASRFEEQRPDVRSVRGRARVCFAPKSWPPNREKKGLMRPQSILWRSEGADANGCMHSTVPSAERRVRFVRMIATFVDMRLTQLASWLQPWCLSW